MRIQGRIAARQADRVITSTSLKVISMLIFVAAFVVLLISLHMALVTVFPPAAAMATIGGVIVVLGLIVLLTGMTIGRRP